MKSFALFKIIFCLLFTIPLIKAEDKIPFPIIENGNGASIYYRGKNKVIQTAIDILIKDSQQVCRKKGISLTDSEKEGDILVGVIGEDKTFDALCSQHYPKYKELKGKWETFLIHPIRSHDNKKKLLIAGSDTRGAAYGILELSRSMGISPWIWWADVVPEKKDSVLWNRSPQYVQGPSVPYRGIFLNDEDWGLMPWSTKNHDPANRAGEIGIRTYSKIFELMMRLRANTLWPAMHECTVPFHFVKDARETAEKYGIIIGTSHCEPMMRNSAGEWNDQLNGPYNFVTNSNNVIRYWKERLLEVGQKENIYTIGMRGKHDGRMQGVSSIEEEKNVLQQVIRNQRDLLTTYVNSNIKKIPQIFVPYKEVLKVYNNGLSLPDDITLMWSDDNHGHLTRLNSDKEKSRTGGSGIYYHISYWGSPQDYLWLASTQPGLIYQEMQRAWENQAHKIWILNVGDIKPGEYLIEFFLDMAWNIHSMDSTTIRSHLSSWVSQQFPGYEHEISPLLNLYYDLAAQRKPEHMEFLPSKKGILFSNPYNFHEFGDEAGRRIHWYQVISDLSEEIYKKMDHERKDSYFQLVHYPVSAAASMNKKVLYAQKARELAVYNLPAANNYSILSKKEYDKISQLTRHYNLETSKGKWNGIMSMSPRNQSVFKCPELPEFITSTKKGLLLWVDGNPAPSEERQISLPTLTKGGDRPSTVTVYQRDNGHIVYEAVDIPKGFQIQTSPLPGGEVQIAVYADSTTQDGRNTIKIKLNGKYYEFICPAVSAKTNLPQQFIENQFYISFPAIQQINNQLKTKVIDSLGHSGSSIVLPKSSRDNKNKHAFYEFYSFSKGPFSLYVGSIPIHPQCGKELRYAVIIDNQEPVIVSTYAEFHTKKWNLNVLRNQSLTSSQHIIKTPGKHTIQIYALDEDLYLDQIMIDFKENRNFYAIPCSCYNNPVYSLINKNPVIKNKDLPTKK